MLRNIIQQTRVIALLLVLGIGFLLFYYFVAPNDPWPPVHLGPRPGIPLWANWIVITTINKPTAQVRHLCALKDWKTVIIADADTPEAVWRADSAGCIYVSIAEQQQLGYAISKHLPLRNYARKNIGYLFAVQHGAKRIYETDDDNQPPDAGLVIHESGSKGVMRLDGGALKPFSVQNPYAHFRQAHIWPRGYPLNMIFNTTVPTYVPIPISAGCAPPTYPIQQGLVDLDPDVDAIFRMTHGQEIGHVRFDATASPVALARGTYCPYNTQNTVHLYEAFWGLVVPVTPTIRVCDIWRSYWVQRILWDLGYELLFMPPTAEQVRNPHDYHKDFVLELDLYTKVPLMIDTLREWRASRPSLSARIIDLAHVLWVKGLWEQRDEQVVIDWIEDLRAVGYQFPAPVDAVKNKTMC